MQRFYTHDNGAAPFMVSVNRKTHEFSVSARSHRQTTNTHVPKHYTDTVVRPIRYERMFVGNGSPRGNSVLVSFGRNRYMFVGHEVFVFGTTAPIASYESPVGNSDVPYPYAIDTNGTVYLMLEKVAFPWSTSLTIGTDPYQMYYTSTSRRLRQRSKTRLPVLSRMVFRPMQTKLVHARLS